MKERLITQQQKKESKEIPSGTIILGDQSPWAGGLLRYKEVQSITDQVNYYIQDVDAPWRQTSKQVLEIKQGWPDYWSLAARLPFSLEIPDELVDNARQSLGSPRGLVYLSGPHTHRTISSESNNSYVVGLLKNMLSLEASWASKVSSMVGNNEGVRKAEEIIQEIEGSPDNISGVMNSLLNSLNDNQSRFSFFTDSFKQQEVQLSDTLPKKYYWVVNKEGTRTTLQHSKKIGSDETLVPKGYSLPLEIAANNQILGFTKLSYLPDVVDLRDRYVPGLKLRLLQVVFDWETPVDPIETMWDHFEEKKRNRGEEPPKPEDKLQKIKSYWRKRPTAISYKVLEGSLNTNINYFEI